MTGLRYSPDMKMIFFSERAGQNTVEYAVNLAEPAERYTLARYAFDDVYANPGTLVGTRSIGGGGGRGAGGGGRGGGGGGVGPVQLSADGSSVFMAGTAYDKNPNEVGPKTFIDKVAIKTGEKQRIYESDNKDVYERVSTALDIEAGRFIVAREGPKEVPQQYLVQNGTRTQLTKNQDYTPDVTNAVVERFTIERPDGFKFKTTVTLPQGYQKGTRLPAIFWFYPREFAGSGRVRPARSHVQQELVPGLRDAVDGVPRPPRLRRRRARFADRRTGRADEQQLRPRSPQQSRGGHRRARQAGDRRPDAARDRRPQLRCVLGGQRDGPHAVLQGRDRR